MSDMEQMLIHRCKRGDLTAFEILISDHEKKIYNIVYRLVENEEDAKDIAQDTFIKAFKGIQSFREESNFSTWLYRIAVNSSKDFLRKSKNTVSIDELKENRREIKVDNSCQPQEQYERAEESQQMIRVLNLLKEEHKNVIILRDIQGFSYDEIADILNISLGTVKSRISRARNQLRSLLMQSQDAVTHPSIHRRKEEKQ